MKKLVFAFLLTLALTIPAYAADGTKIAVIDYRKILQESSASKDITAQLEANYNAHRKEIKKSEDDLRKAQEEIEKQKDTLTADALAAKRKDFQQKVIEVQKKVQSKKRSLDRAMGESREKLNQAIAAVTQEIATKEGYDLVIANSQVIVKSPSLDITDKVLAGVNSKLPKVKVDIKE